MTRTASSGRSDRCGTRADDGNRDDDEEGTSENAIGSRHCIQPLELKLCDPLHGPPPVGQLVSQYPRRWHHTRT